MKVWSVNEVNKYTSVDYIQLLNQTLHDPMIINVVESTNNRQLDFSMGYAMGRMQMLEPSLTIDRQPRPTKDVKCVQEEDGEVIYSWVEEEYITKWNPQEWNIADTQEKFIVDGKEIIDLHIFANQLFEISFSVTPRVDTVKILSDYIANNPNYLKVKNDDEKK